MKKVFHPFTFLFTVTIPQCFLFILYKRVFYFVQSELPETSLRTWIGLGTALGVVGLSTTIYGIYQWKRKKEIHPYIAISLLIFYTGFLVTVMFRYTNIIPATIPNWMLLGIQPGISLLTLLMPVLCHSMILIVSWTVEKYKIESVQKDIPFLLVIPVASYLLINISVLGSVWSFEVYQKLIPILFVMAMISFLFFFTRIIFVIMKQKIQEWQKYMQYVVLGGALIGLLLNQGMGNLFGNFSNPIFYSLAIVTVGLMLLTSQNPRLKLFLFAAKSITLCYSLYFFLVFLPYVPISFVGIVFFGLGILMLTPVVLLILHVQSLYRDYLYLKQAYSRRVLISILLIGIFTIPTVIAAVVQTDQQHMNTALQYVYQRGFEQESSKKINRSGIKRALENIRQMQMGNRGNRMDLFTTSTPFLTALYNRSVLDGLSISDRKINEMESVFFGIHQEEEMGRSRQTGTAWIQSVHTTTEYDAEEELFRSWVDFTLMNGPEWQGEYITYFELPEGAYIGDYYLYVGEEKKHGMIVDKRAANWIYEQIKAIRMDPGVLTYVKGNEIEWKVFPFDPQEIRKTGMEIVHKSSLVLEIDGKKIHLGAVEESEKRARVLEDRVLYIPKEEKETLQQAIRQPAYYFVLDYAKDSNVEELQRRLDDFISAHDLEHAVKEISAVNFQEKIVSYGASWTEQLEGWKTTGGFHLDYTIKRIYYENYINQSTTYPVVIVVGDRPKKQVLSTDYESLGFVAPEGMEYYYLDRENRLIQYSLVSAQENIKKSPGEIQSRTVLVWEGLDSRTFYIANNQQDSIILLDHELKGFQISEGHTAWEKGVILRAMYMSYLLHPEKYFEKSLEIVQESIKGEVMSPLTSFIVLETRAQEITMLEKQKQILATEKPIEIGDLVEMDEPPLWIFGLIFIGIGIRRNGRFRTKRTVL